MDEIIEQYYEAYNFPSSEKLYQIIKKNNHKITKQQIENYINKKEEVQILKETKKNKNKLGHIISLIPNSIWQMDIFFMMKFYKSNHGYKYILCCIDVFTRKVYCEPIKDKSNENVLDAFKLILKKADAIPYVITSDNDSTFLSTLFNSYCEKHKIALKPVVLNDHHSLGIIDRFAKTLKIALNKRFIKYNNTNWVNHLDKIIYNYNNTPHGSLEEIKPNDALLPENAAIIYEINLEKSKKQKSSFKNPFKINDKVRILNKDSFAKKTEGKYSKEIYIIKNIDGKTLTLDNNKKIKYDQVLKIDNNTIINEKTPNLIKQAKKDYKNELLYKRLDVQPENIINSKRERKQNNKYT